MTRLFDEVVVGADTLFFEIEQIDGRNVSMRRIVCMGLAQWVSSGSLVVEDNQRFPRKDGSRGLERREAEAFQITVVKHGSIGM